MWKSWAKLLSIVFVVLVMVRSCASTDSVWEATKTVGNWFANAAGCGLVIVIVMGAYYTASSGGGGGGLPFDEH